MKRQILRHSTLALALLFSVLSCQNPFDVGLGDNVDIDRPFVSLSTPATGSFLRGTVELTGTATDDVSVTSVQLSFDNGVTWLDAGSYNAETGQWRYDLDTTTRSNGSLAVLVRAIDNTGKTTMTETLLFTIDNEPPRVFFTFPAIDPDTYDEANPPTVGRNGAIFGTVSVREGIAVGSPRIKLWRPSVTEPEDWTSLRSGSETPNLYDFRYNLPTGQVGDYMFRVQAVDVGGQATESGPYRITVISGAPQVSITSPGQASYQRGVFAVSGTMSHETGNEPDLRLELYERDELETAEDPVALVVAESAAGDFTIAPNGSGGYTWSYDYDSAEGTRPDGTIVARVYASITDTIGFDTRAFQVDNTAPTLQVNSPAELSTVYGTVTISGTASDNEAVETVEIQIGDSFSAIFEAATGTYNWQRSFDSLEFGNEANAVEVDSNGDPIADGDPSTDIWLLNVYIRVQDPAGNEFQQTHRILVDQDLDKPTVNVLAPIAGSNLAGPVLITGTAFDADPGVARVEMQIVAVTDAGDEIGLLRPDGTELSPATVWHEVSGTTQWSQEINGNGALYNVTGSGRPFEGSGLVHNGRLRIRIRAVDAGGKEGNIQEFAIRLDETIPSITNVTPPSGSYVRGTFNLEADIADDERIENVAVSTDGGQSFDVVYAPASGDASQTNYSLSYPVDTEAGGLNLTSAVRNMRIRVRDNANYTTLTTVAVNIDNWWPDGELVTTTWDPMEMAGIGFQVSGDAWDRDLAESESGFPVRGIEHIDVYIQDLRSGSPTYQQFYGIDGSPATDAIDLDLGNGQGLRPTVSGDNHRIRIGRSDLFSEDGKEIVLDASDFTWRTVLDTTVFPDGSVGVHYLITDRAGNRTHHVENGFVRNSPPVIGDLTVGTDLDYNNTVSLDERFIYSSRFNARGRIYIEPDVTGGNGTPTWELFDSSDLATPLAVAGNVLDISDSTSFPDGEYTLVLRVTDEVGIVAETAIDVRISQEDADPPVVEIFSLTQAIAESVAAENPVAGHIDFLTGTDPYTAGLPKVSGVVPVRGRVSDNFRIQNIELDVPGLPGQSLASWNASTGVLETDDPANFTIDSQILNENDGHIVEWTYLWDTQTHPDVAALNVPFEIRATDFDNPAGSAVQNYDVVPYITDVQAELESGTRRFIRRSALGSYPVRRSETVDIRGFNIGGGATTVSSVPGGLSVIDSTHLQLTVDAGAISGYLVVTNSSVPSINNLNSNALLQNQEPEQFRPDISDDRYLAVWGNTSSGLSGRTDVVLGPNAAGNGFDWMNVQNGQSVRINTGRLAVSWNLQGGSFDRNSDGTLMYVFLHDMNWFSGNDGYQVHGSVQFGIGDVDQGGAYNWQNTNTNRLGLGNLSFQDDPNWPSLNEKAMNRYRNLQIEVDGTDAETNVFAMYFDASAESRGLVFWSFAVGENLAPADQVTTMAGAWRTNLTKQSERTGNYVTGGTNVGLRTPTSRVDVTSGGNDSSEFDFVYSQGTVYLVYYDESTGEFLFQWNDDPVNNPTGGWSTPRVLDQGAGLYPAIEVDPAGGIHVAYHDTSQSNLRYVYLADTASASQPVVIDSLFSNGMNNSVVVREFAPNDYRPVISHFSLAYSGTRFPLRVSYPLSPVASVGAGAEVSTGNYTGAWETVTLLANIAPADDNTFAFLDAAANAVIGYNGATAEYSTLFGFRE